MKRLPWGAAAQALVLVLCSSAASAQAGGPLPDAGRTALTLLEAADATISRHPALAAEEARRLAAVTDVTAAGAARLPSLHLEGALNRFQEPMIIAPLHGFDPERPPEFDRTLVQGAARLRFALFDGGAGGARSRAARAAERGAGARVTVRATELLEAVTESYVRVLAARAVEQAAETQREALEAERARAQRTVESGSAAEVEVLRASAALEEARAEEATARAQRELAERALARTMGAPPTEVVERPLADVRVAGGGAAPVGVSGPPVPDAAASPIHPSIAAADAAARAAEARLSERRAAWLPRLDVTAGLLDYGTVSGGHVQEWQAGVQASWPLFTGGARGAAIERAEAELTAARSERDLLTLAVAAARDAARAAIAEADAREGALDASVARWQEVARIEALALDVGSGVQSDLLSAQAGLFRARAGRAQAAYDAVLARVRLARAEGVLDREWLARNLEIVP